MTTQHFVKAVGAVAALVAMVLAGVLISSPSVKAQDDENNNESRIQQGFRIAPVPLNLAGKNRALVGLGSYLVNGPGDCNACHNAGPGNNQFLPNGNPFFGLPERVNQATYLGGGRNFGPLVRGSANIISVRR